MKQKSLFEKSIWKKSPTHLMWTNSEWYKHFHIIKSIKFSVWLIIFKSFQLSVDLSCTYGTVLFLLFNLISLGTFLDVFVYSLCGSRLSLKMSNLYCCDICLYWQMNEFSSLKRILLNNLTYLVKYSNNLIAAHL